MLRGEIILLSPLSVSLIVEVELRSSDHSPRLVLLISLILAMDESPVDAQREASSPAPLGLGLGPTGLEIAAVSGFEVWKAKADVVIEAGAQREAASPRPPARVVGAPLVVET